MQSSRQSIFYFNAKMSSEKSEFTVHSSTLTRLHVVQYLPLLSVSEVSESNWNRWDANKARVLPQCPRDSDVTSNGCNDATIITTSCYSYDR